RAGRHARAAQRRSPARGPGPPVCIDRGPGGVRPCAGFDFTVANQVLARFEDPMHLAGALAAEPDWALLLRSSLEPRTGCGVPEVRMPCDLWRGQWQPYGIMITRVPSPALSHPRPALRLARPARPVISFEGCGAAGAATRGRRAAPH